MKRVSYLGQVDHAVAAVKRQRFVPVVKRLANQLIQHTRKCVDLLLAFSRGVEKEADIADEGETDFDAFWREVQRRAVAEGACFRVFTF